MRRDGSWTKTVKPWPDDIDDWTHFQHGPDNNAVAEDEVVGPPRRMQWLAGPTWTRHHHSDKGTAPTIRAVVSSRGRLYYTIDETASSNMKVPSTWFLAARDAFSGVLLWKVPIRRAGYQRRLEQVWRGLIADGDAVYAQLGADEPLSELNGATGALNRTYPGTESVSEVIKHQGTLFVVDAANSVLLAFDAASGKLLWRWEPGEEGPMVPLTLAAAEGKVFVRTDVSLRCLAAADGKPLWHFTPEGAGKRMRLKWPRERLLVKDGVVLCSYGGGDPNVLNRDSYEFLGSHPRVHDYGAKLAALSAADGRLLWTTDYLPGLESMPGEIYVSQGRVWLGPDFASPRDLRSGEVLDNRPLIDRLWTAGHHYRCYPGKATSRYILTAKRGIELFDTAGDDHSRNNWVRGTCRVGVTPANGLLYAPPHSCGCYMEAMLFGFWALASEQDAFGRKGATRRAGAFAKGTRLRPAGPVGCNLQRRGRLADLSRRCSSNGRDSIARPSVAEAALEHGSRRAAQRRECVPKDGCLSPKSMPIRYTPSTPTAANRCGSSRPAAGSIRHRRSTGDWPCSARETAGSIAFGHPPASWYGDGRPPREVRSPCRANNSNRSGRSTAACSSTTGSSTPPPDGRPIWTTGSCSTASNRPRAKSSAPRD